MLALHPAEPPGEQPLLGTGPTTLTFPENNAVYFNMNTKITDEING